MNTAVQLSRVDTYIERPKRGVIVTGVKGLTRVLPLFQFKLLYSQGLEQWSLLMALMRRNARCPNRTCLECHSGTVHLFEKKKSVRGGERRPAQVYKRVGGGQKIERM